MYSGNVIVEYSNILHSFALSIISRCKSYEVLGLVMDETSFVRALGLGVEDRDNDHHIIYLGERGGLNQNVNLPKKPHKHLMKCNNSFEMFYSCVLYSLKTAAFV
jgi:hypothetical protein